MIEVKHTLGPWRVTPPQQTQTGQQVHIVAGKGPSRWGIAFVGVANQADAAMQSANAQLIAAAPDLLEGLDGLLEYVGGWDLKDPEHPIVKARAAMSKAIGANYGEP